jgi:UPF0755 protein
MLPAMPRHRGPGRGAARSSLLLFLLLVLLAAGVVGAYRWGVDGSGPTRPVTVDVPRGATASYVANLLEREGIVRSALAFRIAARLRGFSSEIQAGGYTLRTNMSVSDALDALERGPTPADVVEVTFPEGLELQDVAEVAGDALGIGASGFVQRGTSGAYALPPYLPEESDTVEGFLFPKTYEFPSNASVDQVITRLLAQFETEVEGLPWGRARKLGVSPYEVVVIASMIEREARLAEERPKIASVIYNRLEIGMVLGIDATIRYLDPDPSNGLTESDLHIDSPYNTRINPGLPPTPIASPGLASIEAALAPADTDYLFYLLVDEEAGKHRFYESEAAFCADAPGC